MPCKTASNWLEERAPSVLLRLDSAHSLSGTDTYRFNVHGVIALHNARRVVLTMANIFNNEPNINENNNTIVIEEVGGAGVVAVVVPAGQYNTLGDFVTALNGELSTAGFTGTLVASVSPDGVTLQFASTVNDFILHSDEKLVNGTLESTLSDYIGVFKDVTVTAGSTEVMGGAVDLSGLNVVYLESPELFPAHLYSTDGDLQHGGVVKNWSSPIPIQSDYGFRTVHQPPSQEMNAINYAEKNDIRHVTLKLINGKHGKPIKNSFAPFSICLRVYYHD